MQTLAPFLVMIAIFIIIAVLIINLLKYRLQKRIIDSGYIDETIVKSLLQPSSFFREALKWGLILLFGGIGLVVLEFIPYKATQSPLPYGVEAIFLAIGFLIYYLIMRKEIKGS